MQTTVTGSLADVRVQHPSGIVDPNTRQVDEHMTSYGISNKWEGM
jgi:hypothetical protein